MNLWERFTGGKRKYDQILSSLEKMAEKIAVTELRQEEIPILAFIEGKNRVREQQKQRTGSSIGAGARASAKDIELSVSGSMDELEEALCDQELYTKYSDAVLRSFPFADLLAEIRSLLEGLGVRRLVIFLDDFSELAWINQQLFVDIILAPLNNSSYESIKLKIAAYPGRIYYGRIDPSKVDTLSLDFAVLYKSLDIQTAEQTAIDYTTRLLRKRFEVFGENLEEYFEPNTDISEYMRLLFETTFNVPRLMGYVLHYCYLDRVLSSFP